MAADLSWKFLIGFLTLNTSPSLLSIYIISGLVGSWPFAIGQNALGSNSNFESPCAISTARKLAVRTINSATPSDICLTRLNLGTESFSYRHHHAIDSCWCSTDNLEHVTIQVEHRAYCWCVHSHFQARLSSYFSYDESIHKFLNKHIVLIYFLSRVYHSRSANGDDYLMRFNPSASAFNFSTLRPVSIYTFVLLNYTLYIL